MFLVFFKQGHRQGTCAHVRARVSLGTTDCDHYEAGTAHSIEHVQQFREYLQTKLIDPLFAKSMVLASDTRRLQFYELEHGFDIGFSPGLRSMLMRSRRDYSHFALLLLTGSLESNTLQVLLARVCYCFVFRVGRGAVASHGPRAGLPPPTSSSMHGFQPPQAETVQQVSEWEPAQPAEQQPTQLAEQQPAELPEWWPAEFAQQQPVPLPAQWPAELTGRQHYP